MGENSERLAKRILVTQNVGYGRLLFQLALLVFMGLIFSVLIWSMNNYPGR